MPEIRHFDGSVRPGESLTAAASASLGLAGTELTYIRIDHQVRLQFADVEVVIETPFSLTDNDGCCGWIPTSDPDWGHFSPCSRTACTLPTSTPT